MSLIIFSSVAGPNVMMYEKDAHHMMSLMGKEMTERGIVTVEQIPHAMVRLRDAIAREKNIHNDSTKNASDTSGIEPRIGLALRALPLLELLDISRSAEKPVTWGVWND